MEVKISDNDIIVKKVVLYHENSKDITSIYYPEFLYEINKLAKADNFTADDEYNSIGLNSFSGNVKLKKFTRRGIVFCFNESGYSAYVGLGDQYQRQDGKYIQLNCVRPKGTKYVEDIFGFISEYLLPISIEIIE